MRGPRLGELRDGRPGRAGPGGLPLKASLLAGLAASLLFAAPASAQSFLGFRALGVPILTANGREIGLGNLGIGLGEVSVSPTDPASAARLEVPTITASMQPSWGDFEFGDQNGTTSTTRFPLIGVGYPVTSAGGVATVTLAGHMEQRWAGERTRNITLGDNVVSAEERFETDGGTTAARVGWAQLLGDHVAFGFSAGLYTGRRVEVFDRTLDSLAVGAEVRRYTEEHRSTYSGYTFSAGVGLDPHELIHLAGSIEWSSDLTRTPDEDGLGSVFSYGIPLRIHAGGTGRLTTRILLSTSVAYQDWSGAHGYEPGVTSGAPLAYGAGLEWAMIQRETRSLPLRLGYRSGSAPFRFESEDPSETAWTAGVGFNLAELDGVRYGWVDVGVERAVRTSLPLDESFWRVTVSLGVSRF